MPSLLPKAATVRSLVITILGDYVFPTGEGVWMRTLVNALDVFGVREATARQVIARMTASGWLVARRTGREVHCTISERAQRRFAEARPLNAHLMHPEPGDVEWVLLLVTVPSDRQEVRHRLRRRLAAAGWGSVGPMAWLGAAPRCEIGLARTLDELDLRGCELLVRGDLVHADPDELVASAWDLDAINERYRAFATEFGSIVANDDREAFRARTAMIDAWHRSFNADPHLPPRFLPSDWAGEEAREVVLRQSIAWTDAAQRWWREAAARPGRSGGEGRGGRPDGTERARGRRALERGTQGEGGARWA